VDVSKLSAWLLRWLGGERKVWNVVHVPSPEADAQHQMTREIATVREDRKCVRNRIQALLATRKPEDLPGRQCRLSSPPDTRGSRGNRTSGRAG
jgi:transposase